MSSGAPSFGVVPALCNREVWQSSDMTCPAVNDPNITSGFTFNKRSVSLASELRSFVVLRPSPEQNAPSAARYSILWTAQVIGRLHQTLSRTRLSRTSRYLELFLSLLSSNRPRLFRTLLRSEETLANISQEVQSRHLLTKCTER